jgi:myo-inositol-1(or 4)-monophosphatase
LPGADLALLLEAADAAGEVATRHFQGGRASVEKPGGAGPVTEADLEVDRMLRAELKAARPDYGWLSEESTDGPERLEAERVFIVDPIDGTRAFIEGGDAWAHSLSVAQAGRVIAGVVYLPRLRRVYAAAAGEGATLNGRLIRPGTRRNLDGADLLVNATQLDPKYWPGGVPSVARHFRPSLAYRMCLIAQGRFDGMLTFRDAWEWDVAAGELILREAGAAVTDRTGRPARFNNPVPQIPGIVAAGPALHAAILRRL